MGLKSARLNQPDLFFAFVDLKGGGTEMPDVFIVPSEVIYNTLKKYFETGVSRWRWHPRVEVALPYKNNWGSLENHLKTKGASSS